MKAAIVPGACVAIASGSATLHPARASQRRAMLSSCTQSQDPPLPSRRLGHHRGATVGLGHCAQEDVVPEGRRKGAARPGTLPQRRRNASSCAQSQDPRRPSDGLSHRRGAEVDPATARRMTACGATTLRRVDDRVPARTPHLSRIGEEQEKSPDRFRVRGSLECSDALCRHCQILSRLLLSGGFLLLRPHRYGMPYGLRIW